MKQQNNEFSVFSFWSISSCSSNYSSNLVLITVMTCNVYFKRASMWQIRSSLKWRYWFQALAYNLNYLSVLPAACSERWSGFEVDSEEQLLAFVVPREATVDWALFSLTPVCFFCSLSLWRRQSQSVWMTGSTSFTVSSPEPGAAPQPERCPLISWVDVHHCHRASQEAVYQTTTWRNDRNENDHHHERGPRNPASDRKFISKAAVSLQHVKLSGWRII